MAQLSVVIIALNEAANLGACLAAAAPVAEELLVADTGSTDETCHIAEAHGARVCQLPWEGFAATKNRANALAAHDWILSLDADEVLSAELQAAIQAEKARLPASGELAGEFNRLTNYAGRWVRHSGWYPDWKPRLFHRAQAHWAGAYVHEQLRLAPGVERRRLPGLCYHYSVHSRADHRRRVARYAELRAQELHAAGTPPARHRQWLKPPIAFLRHYLWRGGFRDGRAGWNIARFSAYSRWLREQRLRELWEATS